MRHGGAKDRDSLVNARYRGAIVEMGAISFLAMLVGSLVLDATVRPRRTVLWQWRGLLVHALAMTALFGLFVTGSGNFPVAAVLTIAMMALFTITSNAKHAMLGEPLIFSDLALLAALVHHPRFYLTAITIGQRRMLTIGGPLLLVGLAALFVPRLAPHLVGLELLLIGVGGLFVLLAAGVFGNVAREPDIDGDVARNGLIATLLLYWWRWRATPDPVACSPLVMPQPGADAPPDLIVIVQCESFADPVDLTGDIRQALPGLARARAGAWQWGELAVSGFGAYTMRTEFGVLFGRSEAALGFRRYDPFLTAHGETSYALSARLRNGGYHNVFVHPHDMRFYGRDRLMPAIGFDRLIGEADFAPIPAGGGRYIDDRTLGATIGNMIDAAREPTLIYAVTMENHGPWIKDQLTGSPGGLNAYLRHVRSSDTMLEELINRIGTAGRSGLLVFFGDHRPSIPGVTRPGGERHTPYVVLRFSADGEMLTRADARVDLSPDELHHTILRCAQMPHRPAATVTDEAGAISLSEG